MFLENSACRVAADSHNSKHWQIDEMVQLPPTILLLMLVMLSHEFLLLFVFLCQLLINTIENPLTPLCCWPF